LEPFANREPVRDDMEKFVLKKSLSSLTRLQSSGNLKRALLGNFLEHGFALGVILPVYKTDARGVMAYWR
jgi:hypothetical protein